MWHSVAHSFLVHVLAEVFPTVFLSQPTSPLSQSLFHHIHLLQRGLLQPIPNSMSQL